MTPERIAEIRTLLAAATVGPWELIGRPGRQTEVIALSHTEDAFIVADTCFWDRDATDWELGNAALIAHAPTIIAELLAALESQL